MLFTINEARALRPLLAQDPDLKKEYNSFKNLIGVFSVWLFILSTIRSFVVATVVVSLFNQEPNLLKTWNKGEGFGAFFLYLLVLCIPIIGNFVDALAPIVVLIAAFTVGNGIAGNFVPFLLPLAIVYAVTFGLVFISNCIVNLYTKNFCPKIYKEIEFYDSVYHFSGFTHTINSINTSNSSANQEDIEEGEIVDNKDDDEYYDDTL